MVAARPSTEGRISGETVTPEAVATSVAFRSSWTMMAFTATCQGPARVTSGNAEIERAEGGKVVVETTTSDGRGNMVYDQTAVTL